MYSMGWSIGVESRFGVESQFEEAFFLFFQNLKTNKGENRIHKLYFLCIVVLLHFLILFPAETLAVGLYIIRI